MSSKVDEIARLIKGNEPTPLLCFKVSKAREMLAYRIKAECKYPYRKKQQARLKKLAAAVDTVRTDRHDFDLMTLLRAGDDNFFLDEPQTYYGLADLTLRIEEVLGNLPVRQGRDKFFGSQPGPTPQQICAIIVSVLWEEFHAAAPLNTKQEAQDACAALWKAAGGAVKRRSRKIRLPTDKSTDVWRDHLSAAKHLAQSPKPSA